MTLKRPVFSDAQATVLEHLAFKVRLNDAEILALVMLLLERGIVTEEELQDAKTAAWQRDAYVRAEVAVETAFGTPGWVPKKKEGQ